MPIYHFVLFSLFCNFKKTPPLTPLAPDISKYLVTLLHGTALRTHEALQTPRQGILDLGEWYSFLLKELTKAETQFFPSSYARSVFVFDHYQVPKRLIGRLYRLQRTITDIAYNRYEVLPEHYQYFLQTICQAFAFFTQQDLPDVLLPYYSTAATDEDVLADLATEQAQEADTIALLKAVVTNIGKVKTSANSNRSFFRLTCSTDTYNKVYVYLWQDFVYLQSILWQYARLNFTQLLTKETVADEGTEKDIPVYTASADTLVILDPDFLIDASTIANCRLRYGANPLYYLAQKFQDGATTNIHFVKGNMVNTYLDQSFMGESMSAAHIFDELVSANPFNALVLDDGMKNQVIGEVQAHFITLNSSFINQYRHHKLLLEPTFLSEIYGLRGRLDVLVEYEDQPNRQDVIELKTSRDPKNFGRDIDVKDACQAACYSLLLESANPQRTGTSAILYSASAPNDNPLRNSPDDIFTKRDLLKIRNYIAFFEYQLTIEPKKVLGAVLPNNFSGNGLWQNQMKAIDELYKGLDKASPLERDYFYEYARFIAREQRVAKVGANNERNSEGFAGLWNNTLTTKEQSHGIIAFLQFNEVFYDDRGKKLLRFLKTPDRTLPISTFRTGDFVLLYPHNNNHSLHPTQHQVIKCGIKDNNSEELIIAPFNIYFNADYFVQHDFWAVEPELAEIGFNAMYGSLLNFLLQKPHKRSLLLGLQAPTFNPNHIPVTAEKLKPQQVHLLNQILAADNYFLLQGPPGTGKTKVMLKELVWNLLKNPAEKIILLAYTNRAVDEICEALGLIPHEEIPNKPFFLRLGHPETTQYKTALLSQHARNKSLNDTKCLIETCRIFVCTVLTYQQKPELHTNLHFTTAIIDEASQLLEPQIIGILGEVDKFVLIGDEKQLPAVVTQNDPTTDDNVIPAQSEHLHSIGIRNLACSMFERLLENCQRNGWTHAYGMLKDQGRMHADILAFPNKQYYNGNLQTLADWQHEPLTIEHDVFGKSRVVFINTNAESRRNVNLNEADIVVDLILAAYKLFEADFGHDTMGVITPYRAQIAEIRSRLLAKSERLYNMVSVDTVERYQGSERQIIIISMAVNNVYQLKNLHVLNDDGTVDKKLNVALTRARKHLVVVGCSAILRQSPIYNALLQFLEQ